jgi:polar amino acid transport system permease protein
VSPATEATAGPPVADGTAGRPPRAIKAIPLRHPWRWITALIVLGVVAELVYTIATAPDVHWDVVPTYLFQGLIVDGVRVTLELTAISMVIGVVLGVVLAVMRLSPNPVMSTVSWFYIWFFRGTPVLVQIFFWFNLNTVLHHVGIGIPFTNIGLSASTNDLITPFLAAILGLGLNEAAYYAEIVRAGIISVEHGQTEAAQALGMRRMLIMRRVVLPQAMRVILPPTGNETISMLKTSSLAVIAAVPELFTRQEQISSVTFRVVEMATVASIWYLFMTSILTFGQYYLERYFARGAQRELPPTPLQRFRRMLFTFHAPPPVVPAVTDTAAGPLRPGGGR